MTTTVKEWKPIFNQEKLDELERLLFSFFPNYADSLMGYVIMPSHVHLMVGCKNGGEQLSRFMQSYKSLSARKIFPELGSIWMKRFDDLVINSEKQFRIKLNYIHKNPVKSGLVDSSLAWKWSSARFWESDNLHPVLTKDWNWLSDEGV